MLTVQYCTTNAFKLFYVELCVNPSLKKLLFNLFFAQSFWKGLHRKAPCIQFCWWSSVQSDEEGIERQERHWPVCHRGQPGQRGGNRTLCPAISNGGFFHHHATNNIGHLLTFLGGLGPGGVLFESKREPRDYADHTVYVMVWDSVSCHCGVHMGVVQYQPVIHKCLFSNILPVPQVLLPKTLNQGKSWPVLL